MTQQSQSPPNSLPAHQPMQQQQQQRLINGPTTFKNLIPKGTRSAVTSPAIPTLQQQQLFYNNSNNNNNNHNSHIHQNGGVFESSSSSMPPTLGNLLGKRKFEGSNGNVDIDENSNHNRKKMMKKSTGIAFGQISSPNIPPPVNINNINNNSNNSYAVNSLKPVPVLQPQQQTLQNQPTPPLPAPPPATVIAPQLLEAPKKRGRRKGSKGIDSTLNGSAISTDFTQEIQQKIALSAGKRNKTTFELQQMLIESHHQNSNASLPPLVNGDALDSSSLDRG